MSILLKIVKTFYKIISIEIDEWFIYTFVQNTEA